jgi:hypothetical protein
MKPQRQMGRYKIGNELEVYESQALTFTRRFFTKRAKRASFSVCDAAKIYSTKVWYNFLSKALKWALSLDWLHRLMTSILG